VLCALVNLVHVSSVLLRCSYRRPTSVLSSSDRRLMSVSIESVFLHRFDELLRFLCQWHELASSRFIVLCRALSSRLVESFLGTKLRNEWMKFPMLKYPAQKCVWEEHQVTSKVRWLFEVVRFYNHWSVVTKCHLFLHKTGSLKLSEASYLLYFHDQSYSTNHRIGKLNSCSEKVR